jgi:hypothetical protein
MCSKKKTNGLKQRAVTNFLFVEGEKSKCILESQLKMCDENNVDLYFSVAKTDQKRIFIVAPCILISIQFTHKQMHCLLNLEEFNKKCTCW